MLGCIEAEERGAYGGHQQDAVGDGQPLSEHEREPERHARGELERLRDGEGEQVGGVAHRAACKYG